MVVVTARGVSRCQVELSLTADIAHLEFLSNFFRYVMILDEFSG